MRVHHSLRVARRSARVAQETRLRGVTFLRLVGELGVSDNATRREEVVPAHDALDALRDLVSGQVVLPHHHELEVRELRSDRLHLVELGLAVHKDDLGLAVSRDVSDALRVVRSVDAGADAANVDHAHDRVEPFRRVEGQNVDRIGRLDPIRHHRLGDREDVVLVLRPGDRGPFGCLLAGLEHQSVLAAVVLHALGKGLGDRDDVRGAVGPARAPLVGVNDVECVRV